MNERRAAAQTYSPSWSLYELTPVPMPVPHGSPSVTSRAAHLTARFQCECDSPSKRLWEEKTTTDQSVTIQQIKVDDTSTRVKGVFSPNT